MVRIAFGASRSPRVYIAERYEVSLDLKLIKLYNATADDFIADELTILVNCHVEIFEGYVPASNDTKQVECPW